MKILFRLFPLMAAFAMILSCEGNKDNGETGDNGGPAAPSEDSEFYEFPLDVRKDGFEAGAGGVTIKVTSLEENNVVFEVTPGSSIKSYRVDVYPKALIYNVLLTEGCVDGTTAGCEDVLISLMLNSSSSAGTVFNSGTEEFSCKEFDWVNSEYSSAPILPDCDYFLLALGCYDEDGNNPASLSIAHVVTPMMELVGDPQMQIEAETGYRAFLVKYYPNEDCKGFYHWISPTSEIDEYIDLFGERMMRDFCRSTVSSPMDASAEENLYFKQTFNVSADIIRENTAITVAVDANGTPSPEIMRNDFALLEIPDGDFAPTAKVYAGERISATVADLEVEMNIAAMSCFYRIYKSEDAENIRLSSAGQKEAEATSIANEGWGVANKNFSFNSETGKLTGDDFKTSGERAVELAPDTEYVILYVAKNYFGTLSELCFSEPFRTKPLVRDNPDACLADVALRFTDISRWGFKYNFTYDYSTTSCYRFQIVYPYVEDDPDTTEDDEYIRPPHYINDLNDREKWMEFFFDTFQEGPAGLVPVVNMWEAEQSNADSYSAFGYESGVTYVIAYCAEDINGVVGPVKFATATTTEPNPGPNPQITVETYEYDDENGQINVRFRANEDTKHIKYFCVTSADAGLYSSCALHDLVTTGRGGYDRYMTAWESQLMQLGLDTNAETAIASTVAEKNSDSPVLIAAIAIGEENGEDVYSDVAAKIYYKGEFKELADFVSK